MINSDHDSHLSQNTNVSKFFLALIFLIPLQNVHLGKIPSLGPGLNILNILMLLSLISAGLIKETQYKNDYNKILYFMGFSYLLSWIYSGIYIGYYDPKSNESLKNILFAYLFFFLTYKTCFNRRLMKQVFWATVLPLFYMFRVYYTNLSWMGFGHYSDKLRYNGGTFMMLGSNEINAFYATYTFVILSFALFEKNLKLKVILFIGVALNTYCLVYGFSRGAYFSFLVGVLIWAKLSGYLGKLILVLVGIAFVAMVGVKVLPQATTERFEMSFTDEENRDESAESRLEFWSLAFDKYLESPLTGIGYRNFPKVNPAGLDTHNYYVKVMVENGIVGIIAFLCFLKASWRRIFQLYKEAKDPFFRALAVGMMPCFVALLIGNLFGDRFTHYPLITYFYIYMGLVVRALAISREENCSGV